MRTTLKNFPIHGWKRNGWKTRSWMSPNRHGKITSTTTSTTTTTTITICLQHRPNLTPWGLWVWQRMGWIQVLMSILLLGIVQGCLVPYLRMLVRLSQRLEQLLLSEIFVNSWIAWVCHLIVLYYLLGLSRNWLETRSTCTTHTHTLTHIQELEHNQEMSIGKQKRF